MASHHFGKRHFGTDISSPGHFGTCMFRPCGRTGTWTFCLHGHFDTRTFRHGDILAQGIFSTMDISARDILAPEHFGTWIFGHLAKQYGRFGTDILAPVLLLEVNRVHTLESGIDVGQKINYLV